MTIDLNRSWLRRAYYSPAPWAKSVHPLWSETQIMLVRLEVLDDEYGGFEGEQAAVTFLDVYGHVEEVTRPTDDQASATGNVIRREWTILIDAVDDPDLLPVAGDMATFLDEYGRTIEVTIDGVGTPEAGIRDHIELFAVGLS